MIHRTTVAAVALLGATALVGGGLAWAAGGPPPHTATATAFEFFPASTGWKIQKSDFETMPSTVCSADERLCLATRPAVCNRSVQTLLRCFPQPVWVIRLTRQSPSSLEDAIVVVDVFGRPVTRGASGGSTVPQSSSRLPSAPELD
jgi:hypothetical protein